MGAFCCCPSSANDFDDYPITNSIYRNCISLRFFFLQLVTGYGSAFQRIEGRTVSSSSHNDNAIFSGISSQSPDSFAQDACQSVPRPLPFDADQRYSRLHRDGLVLRREKSMTHLQEESQPLRQNISSSGMELLDSGKKHSVLDSSSEEVKLSHSESAEKLYGTKVANRLLYVQQSSEDEDVCPTCLEEYTSENPKITTRCSHYFHLGCIYEWMERSDTCPICGKDMEFCESP